MRVGIFFQQNTDLSISEFTERLIYRKNNVPRAEFIENRLFKPFDTTKGNAGMGIENGYQREAPDIHYRV